MMNTQSLIQTKLQTLHPDHLEILNESSQHNVPAGSESHFKVTVVTNQFNGLNLLARHRIINALLSEELAGSIHALALHTKTPDEWFDRADSHDSPDCLGGSGSSSQTIT
ncbi:MAG: BolA protein [Parasphingorhabdus sp.]|jgi:BolA protein